jgi:hypothetical protein
VTKARETCEDDRAPTAAAWWRREHADPRSRKDGGLLGPLGTLEVEDRRITQIYAVRNPERLDRLEVVAELAVMTVLLIAAPRPCSKIWVPQ